MKLYFAPLEGITTYIYRNIHGEMFGGCDAYYAPFVSPSNNEKIVRKNLKDLLPENNSVPVRAQILTNSPEGFVNFAGKIAGLGYNEVNINFGCPSGTVVAKGKGAAILKDKNIMDDFLKHIFSECGINISVKTRIGFSSAEDAGGLMEIYNKYPFVQNIVHPRTGVQLYGGKTDMEAFRKMYNIALMPVCYNGDVCTVEDWEDVSERFPNLDGVMIGRGAVADPGIFREIRTGRKTTFEEAVLFTHRLLDEYNKQLKSDTFTMYKLKEVWNYMIKTFPKDKKTEKAIKKSSKLSDFMNAVESCGGGLS